DVLAGVGGALGVHRLHDGGGGAGRAALLPLGGELLLAAGQRRLALGQPLLAPRQILLARRQRRLAPGHALGRAAARRQRRDHRAPLAEQAVELGVEVALLLDQRALLIEQLLGLLVDRGRVAPLGADRLAALGQLGALAAQLEPGAEQRVAPLEQLLLRRAHLLLPGQRLAGGGLVPAFTLAARGRQESNDAQRSGRPGRVPHAKHRPAVYHRRPGI